MQTKIENFFKMPFHKIIEELHIKQCRSVHSLGNEMGISHTPFVRLAKKYKLKLRNKSEASSLALKLKNPIHNPEIAAGKAKIMAEQYRNNPLPQEKLFAEILNQNNIEAIFQYPLDKYIIDYYIPSLNLCIEIDSTHKWGHHRRFKNREKDIFLTKKGFKILRISKNWVEEASVIFNILNANNIVRK